MFIVANLILIFFTLTNDLFLQKTFLSITLCSKKKHSTHNFLFNFFLMIAFNRIIIFFIAKIFRDNLTTLLKKITLTKVEFESNCQKLKKCIINIVINENIIYK